MALKRLTATEKPVVKMCRALESMTEFYLLGYASYQGFGSVIWYHEGLIYELANWSTRWKNETSNRKEGTNITVRVENLAEDYKLYNGELFILTENQVFEGLLYKGHSESKKLNELVLSLQLAEMEIDCILHVIHMEGTRTKKSGIYGLSRGDILEGMMTGQNPLDFILMNESADERSGGRVVSWISYWRKDKTEVAWGGLPLKKMTPENWF